MQQEDEARRLTLVERVAEKIGEAASEAATIPPISDERPSTAERVSTQTSFDRDWGQLADPGFAPREVGIDVERLARRGILIPTNERNLTVEEFRNIKRATFLKLQELEERGLPEARIMVVTSTRPSEGKTFTAANLALSLAADSNLDVILIDGDLTRPILANLFGLETQLGFADLLDDSSLGLSDVLFRTNPGSLMVLPAGRSKLLGPELIGSKKMTRLIQELLDRFPNPVIIFDAPPILSTSESSVLAAIAGQIVFVVENGGPGRATIQEALDLLSGCPEIGFVLNKCRHFFGAKRFGSY